MKIGVDAGGLGVQDERLKVGVYTVIKNLFLELAKIDKTNQYTLYSFHPIEKSLMKALESNMKNVVLPLSRGWLRVILPLRLLTDKPDIFLAANQAMPFKFPFSSYKTLGIFYDIAFEKYPELYSYAASVSKHVRNSRSLAKDADALIAISENTKKDLVSMYKISQEKIVVAYPGIEYLPVTPGYKNKHPYFLFVGAFKKSKNVPTLLQAFARFLETSGQEYDLLLAGGDKWLDKEITSTLASLPSKVVSHIKNLGFVDTKKLTSLYKNAIALISPSLYEGFGLTFIEAQSMGCPVIASYRGSLPEIIGNSGMLVDPLDITQLERAMKHMTDTKIRQKYILLGKQNAKKYTWKTFAKQVQSALHSLS
ncbi:MAG TPA: glycosyltransferase family 1 protein [Candidatus Eisenbacteria bacterium]|nr:glycosyltransferase family 1 protein [Candidatus Eisenbacteria bacterium]